MFAPKVSVVVCTYQGEKFLRPQLESLVNQSYTNLEILISDDGSRDDTVAIAQSFAAADSRVQVHVNPRNLGYNKNFEQAFLRASGHLIAVCDQDDIWKANKIEEMLPLFRDEKILLAHCQSVRFTDTPPDVAIYSARRYFEGNDVRKMMFFNTIAGHNIIFRKTLLQWAAPFPENVFYDWWLGITAAAYGQVAGTNKVLTFHRFHSSNLTLGKKDEKKQTREKADERFHAIEKILKLPGLSREQRIFGENLRAALSSLSGKSFSFPLFLFFLRHADTVFFFKKKSWFSRAKMAYRLSFAV